MGDSTAHNGCGMDCDNGSYEWEEDVTAITEGEEEEEVGLVFLVP